MNTFTLDGRSTSEWGIGLSAGGAYDAPARKGETISIPGSNKSIWVDGGGFENVDITYPCWIAEEFDERVDGFRAFLAAHSDAFYRLTDSYHPDEYRMARYSTPFVADPGTRNYSGRFDVTFSCQPERYLVSGEQAVTMSGDSLILNNPTDYAAFPLIEVIGARNTAFSLSVGSIDWLGEMTYSDIVLDTRTLAFYRLGGSNLYPISTAGLVNFYETDASEGWLKSGQNEVLLSGEGGETPAVTVKVTPRWWTI